MTTLFDIAWQVSSELGDTLSSLVTSGTETTLADSVSLKSWPDKYWKHAPVFIIESTDGAAPQSEFARVVSFEPSTFTLTLADTLTSAVQSGDAYLLGSPRYPLYDIVSAINRTLRELGPLPLTDTSLTTATSQTEYTIPATVRDVKEVWLQTINNDADDNEWQKMHDWRIERGAIGSTDTLILSTEPSSNYTLKLVYTGEHGHVKDASDTIANVLDPRIVVSGAVKNLIRNRMRGAQDNDPMLKDQYQDAIQEFEEHRNRMGLVMPKRTPRLTIVGRSRPWLTSGE